VSSGARRRGRSRLQIGGVLARDRDRGRDAVAPGGSAQRAAGRLGEETGGRHDDRGTRLSPVAGFRRMAAPRRAVTSVSDSPSSASTSAAARLRRPALVVAQEAATAQAIACLGGDLLGLQEVYAFQERYLVRSRRVRGYRGWATHAEAASVAASSTATRLHLEASRTRWLDTDVARAPGTRCRAWTRRLATSPRRRFVREPSRRPSAASRERAAEAPVSWPDRPPAGAGDLTEAPAWPSGAPAAGLRDPLAEAVHRARCHRAGSAGSPGTAHRLRPGSEQWRLERAWWRDDGAAPAV
jgi:hypothetical protein